MTWLRPYDRDAALCARAGDASLEPPDAEEALDLVRVHLHAGEVPRPVRARWEFARWKPGTSITAGYSVTFEDGVEAQVTVKRYADSKALAIASGFEPDRRTRFHESRLLSFAALPDGRTCLYAFPADRVLPGVARILHLRRTARFLNALPLQEGWRARGSRSRARLLRYKPERRAVFRLDLVLADDAGSEQPRSLAARALPPEIAAGVGRARRASVERSPASIGPSLVAIEERTGVLFEEWLEAEVSAPDAFDHAREAGEILARLHSLPMDEPAQSDADPFVDLLPLFAVDPTLAAQAARLRAPRAAAARCWIHGDLHPDQVLRGSDGAPPRLLDLDSLGPGTPAADLATWTADHLAADPSLDLADVARPLLDGYARGGGLSPTPGDLAARTSVELVRRAAAGLRRLERGSIDRARVLIERSLDLVSPRTVRS